MAPFFAAFRYPFPVGRPAHNTKPNNSMNMKSIITILVAIFLVCRVANGQEWQIAIARPNAPVSIVVPAKSIIEFGSYRGGNLANNSQTLDFGGGASVTSAAGLVDETRRYVGPVTYTQTASGGATAFVAIGYRITNSTAVSSTPSNAVVIPSNATGDVQIILESSTDLVTWTAASPGSYNSSTQNRFFRVRASQL
jgi:hypothetical protein